MHQDLAAERAVLSSLINNGIDAYIAVSDVINKDCFTIDSNVVIFKCIEHIFKEDGQAKIDIPSIFSACSAVGNEGFFNDAEEKKHLRAIANFPADIVNIRRFAGKIRKLQIIRELTGQVDITRMDIDTLTGDETIEQILNAAEGRVFEYIAGLSTDRNQDSLIGEGVDAYVDHVINNPVKQLGIATGWPNYDSAIGGGLRRKTVGVIGARAKVGKSFTGINIGRNVASQGIPVWYGDTELDKKDHWHRLLGSLARVPTLEIESGAIGKSPHKVQAVKGAAKELESLPYYYQCIAGKPFEETLSQMRRWVLQKVKLREDGEANDCLMIFDYLKLMDSSNLGKQLAEFQVLGFMMTQLHNFAVKYGVPILVLVQLNRDGIDSEETDAVSGSDRIVWLCSHLSLLKWQTPEEQAEQIGQETKFSHKLIPLVSRHGPALPKGEFIHMSASYHFGLLEEGPVNSALKKSGFDHDEID